MNTKKYKRNPKQNFKVNWSEIIVSDKLNSNEKMLLMYILRHHKNHCKFDYKKLFNAQICKDLNISKPTLNTHRKGLEDKNFIEVKTKMNGRLVKLSRENRKSSPLIYQPKFAKLKKLNLIKEEKSSFKETYDKKAGNASSLKLSNGQDITYTDLSKLSDTKLYWIKMHGKYENRNTKALKSTIISIQRSYQRHNQEAGKIVSRLFYKEGERSYFTVPPAGELPKTNGSEESNDNKTSTIITVESKPESNKSESDKQMDKYLESVSNKSSEPKDEPMTEEEQTEKAMVEAAAMVESIEHNRRRR
ncbi:helix-turn-helix domain-containing protein [Flagellimonas sp. CMM7]|uniref:helix-turn-helix domain-containing protein n=1 Tax=Flagellimonas sp. CMM7 TaxID=2654676 RepID=UPI0013D29195|nr:helix-turn-helix domain-containing protein [Flagellimonas sp. CMM7]UII81506.1 helix-turn-helix domain-containing protein [Flagellimonas sp. CMM7]